MYWVIALITAVIFGIYIQESRKNKLNTKTMVLISMFSAIAYILYMIQFIKYPQGGGISLFSMMPVMVLALLYGNSVGLTAGMVLGLLKLLNGGFVVHPLQFILDYILGSMVLGFAGSFGREKKIHIVLGCLLATILSTTMSVISGVVFFGQHAPSGWNPLVYSLVYNCSSIGVEGILTTILVACLPLKRLVKVANIDIVRN